MLHWLFVLLSILSATLHGFTPMVNAWYDLWKLILIAWVTYFALFALFYLFCIIYSFFLTAGPIQKQNKLCRFIVSEMSNFLCIFFGTVCHISGADKLPENTTFMYVCNHVSALDPLYVESKLRKANVCFISKPENFTLPGVLKVTHNAGLLTIDRSNNRNGLQTINDAIRYISSGICSIGVFPEGTRNKTDELLMPFHPGTFKICKRADCPLVIASIANSGMIHKNVLKRLTHIYLDVLEVIPVERVREMTTAELSEYSHDLIWKNLEENYVGKDL